MDSGAVQIGLVGAGAWARSVHVPNLLRVRAATLAAVCTRSADNARSALEAAGRDVPVFDEYDRFLAKAPCDAVIICTPNGLHEACAVQALSAGKHVLCEKPVSLSRAGCDRVGEAVARSGRVFQVGLELRYADVVRVAGGLISAGRLGRLLLVTMQVLRDWGAVAGWRVRPDECGGLFFELACHYTDLAACVLGAQARSVSVAGGYVGGETFAEYASVTLAYPGGAAAGLNVCRCAGGGTDEVPLEIIGDRGAVRAEPIAGTVRLFERGRDAFEDHSPARPADYHVDGFPGSLESLQGFADCIRTGAAPLADFAAGRAATLTAAACQLSLDNHQQVVPIEY